MTLSNFKQINRCITLLFLSYNIVILVYYNCQDEGVVTRLVRQQVILYSLERRSLVLKYLDAYILIIWILVMKCILYLFSCLFQSVKSYLWKNSRLFSLRLVHHRPLGLDLSLLVPWYRIEKPQTRFGQVFSLVWLSGSSSRPHYTFYIECFE